jgi:uncharacterized phage protein (TIGR02218 family)
MTFDARERSDYSGEPFELYRWNLGATIWLQTSGDTPRLYQGQIYEPAVVLRTEVDQNGETSSGNVTVTLELDNPVAQLFREGPPSTPVSLIVTCGHDGETETACVFTGRIMSAKLQEACEFICAPRQAIWKQPIPALTFQCQCPLRWGTARCGPDRSAWRVPATLSAVAGLTVTSSAFAAFTDGHFKGGWIEYGGDQRTVTGHVGAVLTLLSALPSLAAGSEVSAFPGCQGTEDDCTNRYNNLPNHLGFKRIPTRQPFGSGGI